MKGNGFIKSATVAIGLVLGGMVVFSSCATSVEIDNAKKQISALKEEKKKVRSALNQLEALRADTAAYVKQLDNNLATLTDELPQLEIQIGDKEAEIETARVELEEAKDVEEHQYSTMKLCIKYMYENGENSFVDMVTESGSMSELLNRSEYVSQTAEYNRKMLRQYAEAKDDVTARERNLEQERQGLAELQGITQAKQFSVQKLMDSKKAELDSYNVKIAPVQTEIDQYNADIKAQEDQMKRIEVEMKCREEGARKKAEVAGKTYTAQNLGNISFKRPCPSSGRITPNSGDRGPPTESASSNHKGIDIGASTGADIIATTDGEVVISTYSYSADNYIMLGHGEGVNTVYMYYSKLLVGVGEKVKQDQVIAKVGSTGYSTGSHLHFGIRSGGMYVNPRSYVNP